MIGCQIGCMESMVLLTPPKFFLFISFSFVQVLCWTSWQKKNLCWTHIQNRCRQHHRLHLLPPSNSSKFMNFKVMDLSSSTADRSKSIPKRQALWPDVAIHCNRFSCSWLVRFDLVGDLFEKPQKNKKNLSFKQIKMEIQRKKKKYETRLRVWNRSFKLYAFSLRWDNNPLWLYGGETHSHGGGLVQFGVDQNNRNKKCD